MSCHYFHVGFATRTGRDNHLARHDKPFFCTYPMCDGKEGFDSKRALNRHLKDDHHEITLGDDDFNLKDRRTTEHGLDEDDMEDIEAGKAPTAARKFRCNVLGCSKSFTRKANLESHERSHYNVRPFKCKSCGTRFTRQNDCTRHAKSHDDSQSLVCRGLLGSDPSSDKHWGCGKSFKRSDHLAKHCAESSCMEDLVSQVQALGVDGQTIKYMCKGALDTGETWGCEKAFEKRQTIKKHWKTKQGRNECLKLVMRPKPQDSTQPRLTSPLLNLSGFDVDASLEVPEVLRADFTDDTGSHPLKRKLHDIKKGELLHAQQGNVAEGTYSTSSNTNDWLGPQSGTQECPSQHANPVGFEEKHDPACKFPGVDDSGTYDFPDPQIEGDSQSNTLHARGSFDLPHRDSTI
ncbi:MAG: hypothetical protein M1831_001615 [Alyxoria varia]|nr:MAG: hypothetical protein M1831_001615 [Alyxoria varia]